MTTNLPEGVQWTVKDEVSGSRVLVASIDLEAGTSILMEQPLIITPHWDKDELKCDNCCEDSHTICKQCQFFPLCIDCVTHDAFACNFFATLASTVNKNFLLQNFSVYGVLKLLLYLEETSERPEAPDTTYRPWENIDLDRYRGLDLWQEHEELLVQPILQANLLTHFQKAFKATEVNHSLESDFLHRLCIAIDENAFEVRGKVTAAPLKGIYTMAATLPHHCVPNIAIAIDDDYNLKVYTTVSIKAEQILYNSYTNPLMGTGQRRHHLQLTRHFHCQCSRCQDPSELQTHMSSLKCAACAEGYVILRDPEKNLWSCLNCEGSTMTTQEVDDMVASAAEKLMIEVTDDDDDDDDGGLYRYESLLSKYQKIFHPNHFLVLEVKQNLAIILRSWLMKNALYEPSKEMLKRKLELSEDLLPVVRVVVPGYSKLYALALYEHLLSFVELMELEFRTKSISKQVYVLRLRKAQSIARECQEMLKFEWLNSAEGQLIRRLTVQQQQFTEHLERFADISGN